MNMNEDSKKQRVSYPVIGEFCDLLLDEFLSLYGGVGENLLCLVTHVVHFGQAIIHAGCHILDTCMHKY